VDSLTIEAAARNADANWAAAATSSGVDLWMSFYAVDAIVLLPVGKLASGTEFVQQAVSRLLALPHLSVEWRPLEAKVSNSGELAFLIDAYELRFDDAQGVPVTERGRRLEIWRHQADAGWKCVVDTWNLDAAGTAHSAAPPSGTQGAVATAASPALPAEAGPTPSAPLAAGPSAPAREPDTKYGETPTHYEEAIRKYFLEHLKHAESIKYRDISKPEHGYTTKISGRIFMREERDYGWKVTATIDAKDSHDSYVGFKTYTFLFRGEKILDTLLPLPGDEKR